MKKALYTGLLLLLSWAVSGQAAGLRLPEPNLSPCFASPLPYWKSTQPARELPRRNPSLLHEPPHMAFFCQLELHIEHRTRLPVKFRLGTVEYVDALEGKRSLPGF